MDIYLKPSDITDSRANILLALEEEYTNNIKLFSEFSASYSLEQLKSNVYSEMYITTKRYINNLTIVKTELNRRAMMN